MKQTKKTSHHPQCIRVYVRVYVHKICFITLTGKVTNHARSDDFIAIHQHLRDAKPSRTQLLFHTRFSTACICVIRKDGARSFPAAAHLLSNLYPVPLVLRTEKENDRKSKHAGQPHTWCAPNLGHDDGEPPLQVALIRSIR